MVAALLSLPEKSGDCECRLSSIAPPPPLPVAKFMVITVPDARRTPNSGNFADEQKIPPPEEAVPLIREVPRSALFRMGDEEEGFSFVSSRNAGVDALTMKSVVDDAP